MIPGNVIDLLEAEMAQKGAQIDRAMIEHVLGLDVPIYTQYWRWLSDIVLHGDFRTTMLGEKPVIDEITSRLPVTLELSLLAIIVGVIISIPIGTYSAIRQDTISDYVGRTIAIIAISIPVFWIGTLIMIYPSLWWGWSDSSGLNSQSVTIKMSGGKQYFRETPLNSGMPLSMMSDEQLEAKYRDCSSLVLNTNEV